MLAEKKLIVDRVRCWSKTKCFVKIRPADCVSINLCSNQNISWNDIPKIPLVMFLLVGDLVTIFASGFDTVWYRSTYRSYTLQTSLLSSFSMSFFHKVYFLICYTYMLVLFAISSGTVNISDTHDFAPIRRLTMMTRRWLTISVCIKFFFENIEESGKRKVE